MKSKSGLFLLIPVAASLLMLGYIFNPAMADRFTGPGQVEYKHCSSCGIPIGSSNESHVIGKTFTVKRYATDPAADLKSCPFSDVHQSWVKQYREQVQRENQIMVDRTPVHEAVTSPAPRYANFELLKAKASVSPDRGLTYAF